MKIYLILTALISSGFCGHYYNYDGTPNDPYYDLHLPHYPALYPTYHAIPYSGFSCAGLRNKLWADYATKCQGYHLCLNEQLVTSQLCTNGTLFNEQFQVCDQFYNVRCGSPYEDL